MLNGGNVTSVSTAVGVSCDNKSKPTCADQTVGIAAAVQLVKNAEVAVLVLGNDRTQEREGRDRANTNLPGLQSHLAKAVLATGIPTLLVLSNGGAIAFDELDEACKAIVEAFNP